MDQKKKWALGLVVGVFLIAGLGLGYRNYSLSKLEARAESAFDQGQYVEAKVYYEELAEGTRGQRYQQRLEALAGLIESKQHYEKGKELLEAGDLEGAINALRLVSSEDQVHYGKARDLVNARLDDLTQLAKDYGQAGDEEALAEIKRKVDAFYGRSDVLGDIVLVKKEEEPEVDADEKPAEEEKEKAQVKRVEEKLTPAQQYTADDPWIGRVVVTTAKSSNLRSGPGLGYSIITHVSKGSTVEIIDAVYEPERTWYRAYITSSVTYNTYDAWISSRNLR